MSITAHLLTPAAFSVSLALTRLRFFDSLTDEEDPGYVQDRPVAMEEFFSGGGGLAENVDYLRKTPIFIVYFW